MRVEFPSPLKDGNGPAAREFGGIELIGYFINTQPQFTMDRRGLQSAMRLEIAMREKTNNQPLFIEWRDLESLVQAADKPRNGYPIQPARALLPFISALDMAQEHQPEAPAEEPSEAPN